ncbi:hypothetical protein HDV02_005706 [Globomyces sp. JEL0801]|nr:hypothetical protein HDV02_005706 [Globomyces sp. JEL0801]
MKSRKILLREIKALGGDSTDLDLINEVLSGSEGEEEDVPEVKKPSMKIKVNESELMKDLFSFVNNLGLESSRHNFSDEDDNELPTEKVKEEIPIKKTKAELKLERKKKLKEAKELEKQTKVDQIDLTQFSNEFLQDDPEEFNGTIATYDKKNESNVRDMVSQILKGSTPTDKLEKQLLIEPTDFWYNFPLLPIALNSTNNANPSKMSEKYELAKSLWEEDVRKYEKKRESASKANKDFVATVLRNGTVTDKVSALTLLIQESPLHCYTFLYDQLIAGMSKKKARREAMLAIDSVKDLMLNTILPDRKLKYFVDQPALSSQVTNQHLIIWYFEDKLKKAYFEFIQIIEELSRDNLPHVKNKMLSCIFDLLKSKPEEEGNLLSLLGDLDKKIASKATFQLSQLLIQHPKMKVIVIKEVERLLYRPNVADRARYYAITFLNQIVLTKNDSDIETANHLIHLYFIIFESMVKLLKDKEENPVEAVKTKERGKKKGGKRPSKFKKKVSKKSDAPTLVKIDSVNSKLMAALLTGVNRAFPFAKLDTEVFESHMNTLFVISHIANFNTSIQALTLIFQVQSAREALSDRFYRTLYDTLFDRRLYDASRHAMYLNLLYRALKADGSIERVEAFVKRIVQTNTMAQVPLLCGSLFLISELCNQRPGIWSLITQPEDDDEDEVFKDVELSEDDNESQKETTDNDEAKDEIIGNAIPEKQVSNVETAQKKRYDGRKRDPLYAYAGKSCFWELAPFTNHFHPTVSLYAKTLLSGNPIVIAKDATNYDPLLNHTISRFLDRFIYKAPKKVKSTHHGTSLMQPRAKLAGSNMLVSGGRKKTNAIFEDEDEMGPGINLDDKPVNQKTWKDKGEENIPADEKEKKPAPEEVLSDIDSDQDIEEDEIWNAMQNSVGFDKNGLEVDGEDPEFDDEELKYDDDDEEDDEEDFDEETFKAMDGFGGSGSDDDDEAFDEETIKGLDGFEGSGSDDNDEMSEWADLNQNEDESDIENEDIEAIDGDGSDEDAEFASMFNDEMSDLSEEEEESKSKKKSKKPKNLQKLSDIATKLGYQGDFFDTQANGFASAEDFASMIDRGSESENENEKKVEKVKKRKFSGKGNSSKKSKRR